MPALLLAMALTPCPSTPNCVSSSDPDQAHRVEALAFSGSPDDAWARLKSALALMPRLEIVESKPGYLHAVETSFLWRFKDDVEFSLDAERSRIDMRSCSRTGSYDFGVNRKRVEKLRALFASAAK